MRNEGNFLPKQKIPFYKKIFSAEKILRHFEFRTSHFELNKTQNKKLPIHKGTRRLAVPPLFRTNVLHSFALTQHHVLLNVQTYFSQKAPALKFSPAPYKSTYSRWCLLSWKGVTKLTYTHSSPLCYDDTINRGNLSRIYFNHYTSLFLWWMTGHSRFAPCLLDDRSLRSRCPSAHQLRGKRLSIVFFSLVALLGFKSRLAFSNKKTKVPTCVDTFIFLWCERRDLNPYGLPHAP